MAADGRVGRGSLADLTGSAAAGRAGLLQGCKTTQYSVDSVLFSGIWSFCLRTCNLVYITRYHSDITQNSTLQEGRKQQ